MTEWLSHYHLKTNRTCRSALSAPSPPRAPASAAASPAPPLPPAAAMAATPAWDVPMAMGLLAAAPARSSSGPPAMMARSMPRPISGSRLHRLNSAGSLEAGAGGAGDASDDGDDGGLGGFVPPHLAASMVERSCTFAESLSTFKGAAGRRLRQRTMLATGFLEGRAGGVGVGGGMGVGGAAAAAGAPPSVGGF